MTIARPFTPPSREQKDGFRINEAIKAREIRLIDENGEMVGVVTVDSGIKRAYEAGLDLIEVSPNAKPPVCKILDYGKFKYEQQKKANEAKKKQKVMEVKEIKLRPTIEDHDFGVKMKAARRFIEDGNKVKVTLRFRGREMAHMDLGMEVLKRVQEELIDVAKTDQAPKPEGRQVMMVLSPDSGK